MAAKGARPQTSSALGRLNVHGANVLRLREQPASKRADQDVESPAPLRREKSEGALCFRGGRHRRLEDTLRSPGAVQAPSGSDSLFRNSAGTKFAKERSPNKQKTSPWSPKTSGAGRKESQSHGKQGGMVTSPQRQGGRVEERLVERLRTACSDNVRFEPSCSQRGEAMRCSTSPGEIGLRPDPEAATAKPSLEEPREPRYCPPTPLISRPTMFYRIEPLPTWPQNSPPPKTPLLKQIMPDTFTRRELMTRPIDDIPEPPQRAVPSLTHFSQHGIPDRPKTAVSPEQLSSELSATRIGSRPGTSMSHHSVQSRPGTSMSVTDSQARPATAALLKRALETWALVGDLKLGGEEEEGVCGDGGLEAVAEDEELVGAGEERRVGAMVLSLDQPEDSTPEVSRVLEL
jgi:hypothetical protein